MYNLDGSEGKMCGNGIRCVAKFMRDNGLVDRDEMTIETLSGIIKVSLSRHYGEVNGATVDMGKAILEPAQIPVALDPDENGRVVANCHFCNKKYIFNKEDLEKIIKEKNSKDNTSKDKKSKE